MKYLSLAQNQFDGEVCFSDLPESLQVLALSGNAFSGSVQVNKAREG